MRWGWGEVPFKSFYDAYQIGGTIVSPKSIVRQKPIFVSHADADKLLVAKFVDGLLLPGLDITTSKVFCTSLEGMKIPAGKNFIDFVREQIQSPQVVLMLLTPNYFDKVFCCCEMGASWALAHEGIPILVPPLDYDDMEAVLKTTQAVKIDEKRGLNEIKDRIVEILRLPASSTERWEQKRDQFLAELPSVLKKLPPSQKVDRSQYEKLEKKYTLQIQDLKTTHETIAELETTIEELREAKDKEQVEQIIRRRSTPWEEFEALVEAIKECAEELPKVVVELIFCEGAGLEFRVPDQFSRYETAYERAIADNLISNPEQTGKIHSMRDDPTIEQFCDVIAQLRAFLYRGDPENVKGDCHEFYKEYRARYKHNPAFGNRRLWSEVLDIIDR